MGKYIVCVVLSEAMPEKCCVPGCRGNYQATAECEEEKVSVFRFPKDPELRAKWITPDTESQPADPRQDCCL